MTTNNSLGKSKMVKRGSILLLISLIAYVILFIMFSNCSMDFSNGFASFDQCQSIWTYAAIAVTFGIIGFFMLVIGITQRFLSKPSAQVDQSTLVEGDQYHGDRVSGHKVSAGTVGDIGDKIRFEGDTYDSSTRNVGDRITVGTIRDSNGVAIGREASATATIHQGERFEFATLLVQLETRIRQIDGRVNEIADLQDEVDSLKQLLQSNNIESRKLEKFNRRLKEASLKFAGDREIKSHVGRIDQLVQTALK